MTDANAGQQHREQGIAGGILACRRRLGKAMIHARIWSVLGVVIALTGCGVMKTPDAQSIQGLQPSGTVSLTESFVGGVGGGSGTLSFNGQSYPFRLVGSVIGPGGAERLNASGEVYKLGRSAILAAVIRRAAAVLASRSQAPDSSGWRTVLA